MAGRAAIIINSLGCSPVVSLSTSYQPVARPVTSPLCSDNLSRSACVFCKISLIDLNSLDFLFFTMFNIFFSELSNISFTVSSVLYPSDAISVAVSIKLLRIDASSTFFI